MEAKEYFFIHIDLDGEDIKKWKKEYKQLKEILKNVIGVKTRILKIRKTINGYHIYLEVSNIPKVLEEENFSLWLFLNNLEVIFGSDRKRAIFNILRILHNWDWKHISILFKDTELKTIRWELWRCQDG